MKKIVSFVVSFVMTLLLLALSLTGCESGDRWAKDVKSNWNGGLKRTVTVYSATGEEIAKYEGKFDIQADSTGSGKVKFDVDGKRVIIYNATVITEEK